MVFFSAIFGFPPQDANAGLLLHQQIAWCAEIVKRDRVGFICDEELRALQQHFAASRSLAVSRPFMRFLCDAIEAPF